MPIHIQPLLRAREEAMEQAGLIQKIDSAGVTIQKAKEASHTHPKVVPACGPIIFNNSSYQPK